MLARGLHLPAETDSRTATWLRARGGSRSLPQLVPPRGSGPTMVLKHLLPAEADFVIVTCAITVAPYRV
jgi:hypothetical protein